MQPQKISALSEAEKQALALATTIVKSLRGEGRLARLDPVTNCLLYAMLFEHSHVEDLGDDEIGLVVRTPIRKIASQIGLSKRSGYVPCRRLESEEIITRITGFRRGPDSYVFCWRFPSNREGGANVN